MLFKGLQITKADVLIDESILVELPPLDIANQTGREDEFDVDLATLARILHLFVGLGNIL